MDDIGRQQWAAQLEAARERADVASRALFTVRGKLEEEAKVWARDASHAGRLMTRTLQELAADCNEAWHAAIEAHEAHDDPPQFAQLRPRAEATYLTIVGALLELVLGKSETGRAHSVFNSQAAIIDALIAHNPSTPGISKTTLEGKFAEGRRQLQST